MTFDIFMIEFGLLIKSSRKIKNLTLYEYAFEANIVIMSPEKQTT